jgi:uncharacterized repeat protein (TIGR01451 family)
MFAMASVCAGEANDTAMGIADENQIDTYQSNEITEEITSENGEILAADGKDIKFSEKAETDNVQSQDSKNNNLKVPTDDSKFNYTDLSIFVIAGSGTVNVGDTVEITVTVRNIGPGDEAGLYALAALNTEFFPNYTFTASEGTTYDGYTWVIGNLSASETATLKISAEVVKEGVIKNYVEIFGFGNDTDKSNNNDSVEITVNPVVDLGITIDADVNCVRLGDNVQFNITVVNNGPCDATNVNVAEVLSEHLRMTSYYTWDSSYDVDKGVWHIGNLTKGDWRRLVIVTQAISVGTFSNEVSVTSTEYDPSKSNNNARSGNIVIDKTDLMISQKSNATSGVVNVGDLIEITVTAHNKGIFNESGIYVLEALNQTYLADYTYVADEGTSYDGYTWSVGNLNSGESATLKIVARVINPGSITNYVEIFGGSDDKYNSDNKATMEITANPVVDLSITIDNDVNCVHFGDQVIFTITVVNNGPCYATNINVSEVLSQHLRMTDYYTWMGSYDANEGVWHLGDLPKGEWCQIVIITEAISEGVVCNEVSVTSTEYDTDNSNNKACSDNIIINETDLRISIKSNVTSGIVNITDYIEYTITVHNNGIFNESGIAVNEILDYAFLRDDVYEASKGSYIGSYWDIGDLNSGESATLKVVARLIDDGVFTDYVEIRFDGNDKNASDNSARLEITANPLVDLVITKEADVTYAHVGDRVVFTLIVENKGPSDATNINVSEVLSQHLRMTGYYTWASNYNADEGIWHIDDLPSYSLRELIIVTEAISTGIISNEVSVTCNEYDTNKSNNKARISDIVIDETDVMISIESNVTSGVADVGDLIEFTVTAYNNGKCKELGIYVWEALNQTYLANCSYVADEGTTYDWYTWVIGNMNPGENATLKIVARIIKDGNFTNYVKIYVYGNDINESNNWDEINITAEPVVSLKVNATADNTNILIGDVVTYTITIINGGPSDASHVNVTCNMGSFELINASASLGEYVNGTWQIGDLVKDGFANLTLTVKPLVAGVFESNFSASSLEKDYNASDNQYSCENVDVNKIATQISGKAITATYNKDKNLVIILKDEKGNPVSGVILSVKIKSSKKYTTDENGQIKVSTKGLAPKKYTAKITFAENAEYLSSSAKIKVTVKKANVKMIAKAKAIKVQAKTKKYTITLKNNVGKPIKNAKVTLKLKGKTYKATTNSKGKATFKIKNFNKVGKYKVTIKYKGDKYYNKKTKKVKIKVYFKTTSKGSKDKDTVKKIQQALKDNGYYLTFKGHYLKVDGKYESCTVRSVKEFQHDKGLKVTGKVDEKTAKKLKII